MFKPKGEKAQWKKLYEFIINNNNGVGTVFNFTDINEKLDIDIKTNRGPIYRTNKELLTNFNIMLKPIRNTGYKIATPPEQLKHGSFRELRAHRQLKKGILELTNLESKDLTDEQREFLERKITRLQLLNNMANKRMCESMKATQEANLSLEKATDKQELAIESLSRLSEEIEKLKNELTPIKKAKKLAIEVMN
jgi:hypothetical protein